MPTIDITRPELIWPGKYDEKGNRVENRGTALPFQVIETIKEGRATREPGRMGGLFSFAAKQDENNRHNKLIWGDSLLVLASLMEEYAGKVDLIYIDPPFATGSEFSFTAIIGESGVEVFKEQSAIEVKACRDTWGRGLESYLQMLSDRLVLIRGLLSENGSLYLHLDDHVSHYVKALADEVFGRDSFVNEIVCQRTNAELYPKVREYVQKRCFGGTVELDDVGLRRALNHSGLLDAIAGMFGRKIGELTATLQPVKLTGNDYLLSETEPFLWWRMIAHADRTIFNVVPCYNDLELGFASFLNGCDDIDRFAALAEWFTKFHVRYLSLTGSIRLYYPDFVAVQTTPYGEIHWILETKGREFEETTSKDFHMARWCEDVSHESGESWRYLKVLQPVFEDFIRRGDYRRFEALLKWEMVNKGLFEN